MNPPLAPDLLDDFYAECEEHFTHIRTDLATLEASVGRAQPEAAAVEDLFRNVHSFKGISAIVGLAPAEELAHSTEDFLRDLLRGTTTLSTEGLDMLIAVTGRLEQIVAAFRAQKPSPEITDILERLQKFVKKTGADGASQPPSSPAEAQKPDVAAQIESARERGMLVWRCVFSPTQELDKRGVNVNSVRARLGAVGEIFHAEPKVQPGGTIVFEFLVAMREGPSDLSGWDADSLLFRPYEQASATVPLEKKSDSASHTPFLAPSHFVRVDLTRLDELMRITGEMVIQRSRLEDQISRSSAKGEQGNIRPFQELSNALGRTLRELREAIMRVRLVSVAEIFSRMPFVVRDLARESGKKVRLTLEGQQTEVDKYLVEQLKDPLLHIVRNSVSHGVESPQERIAAGKPEEATITLKASTRGDSVVMEISDDGRGVDVKAVRRRAELLGLPIPAEFDQTALVNLLCAPGFSTREEADLTSGRGVGMAVVYNSIREMGGILALENHPGQGCKFILRFPLTLAIADAFIVSVSSQLCAVPQSFVQEVMQLQNDQLQTVDSTEVIPYQGGVLPLLRLSALFGLPPNRGKSHILVLQSENGSKGLVVDRIHGHREIVVRSIRDPLVQTPEIAAATELGDGPRPVLILNAAVLTSGAIRPVNNWN